MRKRSSVSFEPATDTVIPAITGRSQASLGSPKIKKYILALLCPIFLVILTFLSGIILMGGTSPSQNTILMNLAVTALLITTIGYITAPSYLIGVASYALIVKKFKRSRMKSMWIIPFVQILFIWFPSYIKMADNDRTWASLFSLAGSAFVFTSFFIGILQIAIIFRRRWKNGKEIMR